jgi:hypothetical protein
MIRRHVCAAGLVLGFAVFWLEVTAQRPARDLEIPGKGSSVISGIVTAVDTGSPLPYAQVALSGAGRSIVTANERGEYVFTDLPAGRFTLMAGKTGYLAMGYGGMGSAVFFVFPAPLT